MTDLRNTGVLWFCQGGQILEHRGNECPASRNGKYATLWSMQSWQANLYRT